MNKQTTKKKCVYKEKKGINTIQKIDIHKSNMAATPIIGLNMPRKLFVQQSVLQSRKGSKDFLKTGKFDALKDLSLPKFARHSSIEKSEKSSRIERISFINGNEQLQKLSLKNGEQHPSSVK